MKKYLAAIVSFAALAVFSAALCPVREARAEEPNVVYLRDGGSGDGSSADQAVGNLLAAYSALDMEGDATIVVCGPFTQAQTFDYALPFGGSVTFTSVYDGVDYRDQGAVYEFEACRFICYGDTRFERMDFHALGAYLLVVGQHNPVTIGEGVTITGDQLTGGSIAKSFSILGGYQKGVGEPPFESDADTNITVLSGSKIYIVAFSRQLLGTYTGTAHIKVGGYADVSVLHGSAAYPDGIILGTTQIEITDDARVRNLYGCTQDTDMEGFELTWESGSIDKFEWTCSYTPGKYFKTVNDTVLRASEEVQEQADFEEIAPNFDLVLGLDEEAPQGNGSGDGADAAEAAENADEGEAENSGDAQAAGADEAGAEASGDAGAFGNAEAAGANGTGTENSGDAGDTENAAAAAVKAAEADTSGGMPIGAVAAIAVVIVAAAAAGIAVGKKRSKK